MMANKGEWIKLSKGNKLRCWGYKVNGEYLGRVRSFTTFDVNGQRTAVSWTIDAEPNKGHSANTVAQAKRALLQALAVYDAAPAEPSPAREVNFPEVRKAFVMSIIGTDRDKRIAELEVQLADATARLAALEAAAQPFADTLRRWDEYVRYDEYTNLALYGHIFDWMDSKLDPDLFENSLRALAKALHTDTKGTDES